LVELERSVKKENLGCLPVEDTYLAKTSIASLNKLRFLLLAKITCPDVQLGTYPDSSVPRKRSGLPTLTVQEIGGYFLGDPSRMPANMSRRASALDAF